MSGVFLDVFVFLFDNPVAMGYIINAILRVRFLLCVNARQRVHTDSRDQHHWLASVLRGHYAYYGLPSNFVMLLTFHDQVQRIWYRTLRKRSRKHRLTWDRFSVLLECLPLPRPESSLPGSLTRCFG